MSLQNTFRYVFPLVLIDTELCFHAILRALYRT